MLFQAKLVCQQLGFIEAMAYIETSVDGKSLDFVMADIDCFPRLEENPFPGYPPERIQDCSYHSLNVTCNSGIAGVFCQGLHYL